MKKSIKLLEKVVEYDIRTSRRARYVRLTIYPGGRVVVTLPSRTSEEKVERFMYARSKWILDKITHLKTIPERVSKLDLRKDFLKHKMAAYDLVRRRLIYFNAFYRVAVRGVSIRNQKTRWGSCSKKGNLNFNYKIVLLPSELADYIIVHELCHLQEMNHSKKFWNRVAETIPNYKQRRKQLKNIHLI